MMPVCWKYCCSVCSTPPATAEKLGMWQKENSKATIKWLPLKPHSSLWFKRRPPFCSVSLTLAKHGIILLSLFLQLRRAEVANPFRGGLVGRFGHFEGCLWRQHSSPPSSAQVFHSWVSLRAALVFPLPICGFHSAGSEASEVWQAVAFQNRLMDF